MLRLVAGLAGLTLLASCTGATSSTPTASSGLPPRPQQLRLDGVDTCGLLTPEQRRQLGLNDASPPPNPKPERPTCQFAHFPGEPNEGYDLRLELTVSAASALASEGSRVVSVTGFGAVETRVGFGNQEHSCAVSVDVADNQDVVVLYSYDGRDIPMTRAVACEKARAVAELAVKNLIAQQR